MQMLINISEEQYESIKKNNFKNGVSPSILDAIRNGTPLPKGHGKLVDVNELKKEAIRCEWSRNMYDTLDHTLSYMKPIIEAESEENE